MRNRFPIISLSLTAVTLLLAALIHFDVIPELRGDHGWRWPYEPVATAGFLIITLMTVIYLGGVTLLHNRQRAWPLLLWAVIGTILMSAAVAGARGGDAGFTLFVRTVSPGATGPHTAGAIIDWQNSEEWLDWPVTMARISGHIGTSPPGLPMWYGLMNTVLGEFPGLTDWLHREYLDYQCDSYILTQYTPVEWASAWFGIWMPLWAGLAVIPLYSAGRRLLQDDALARWVVILWPVVPAVIAFSPSWNTVFPLMAITCFALFLKGMETHSPRQWLWFGGAGLVLGIALFSHFVFLPMLGLLGFYTLGMWWLRRDRLPFSWAVMIGAVIGAGVALPWLVYWLAGGATVFAVLEEGFGYHLTLERPAWFWRYWNAVDWVLWSGFTVFVWWIMGLLLWARRRHSEQPLPPLILSASLLLTVLVMSISATTLGESGRIWLFITPFALIAGVDAVRRWVAPSQRRRVLWLLVGSQAVMVVILGANVLTVRTPFFPPPADPPQYTASRPVDATFTATDGAFRLTAWDASPEADYVELTLNWVGIRRPTTVYWFGALMVGPDGATSEMKLWQPNELAGQLQNPTVVSGYPTTCWTNERQVGDRVRLPLPADAPPGEWWISLAAFGYDSGPEGRVPVMLPDGTQDVQVGLGPVVIGE